MRSSPRRSTAQLVKLCQAHPRSSNCQSAPASAISSRKASISAAGTRGSRTPVMARMRARIVSGAAGAMVVSSPWQLATAGTGAPLRASSSTAVPPKQKRSPRRGQGTRAGGVLRPHLKRRRRRSRGGGTARDRRGRWRWPEPSPRRRARDRRHTCPPPPRHSRALPAACNDRGRCRRCRRPRGRRATRSRSPVRSGSTARRPGRGRRRGNAMAGGSCGMPSGSCCVPIRGGARGCGWEP